MLYQSLGQFGREGKRAWYDSAGWRACAAVKDPDTANELSEVCGSCGVIQTNENRSKGSQRQPGQLLARDSRQKGESAGGHRIGDHPDRQGSDVRFSR
jgi:type IV secretion system protein VirD4